MEQSQKFSNQYYKVHILFFSGTSRQHSCDEQTSHSLQPGAHKQHSQQTCARLCLCDTDQQTETCDRYIDILAATPLVVDCQGQIIITMEATQ